MHGTRPLSAVQSRRPTTSLKVAFSRGRSTSCTARPSRRRCVSRVVRPRGLSPEQPPPARMPRNGDGTKAFPRCSSTCSRSRTASCCERLSRVRPSNGRVPVEGKSRHPVYRGPSRSEEASPREWRGKTSSTHKQRF